MYHVCITNGHNTNDYIVVSRYFIQLAYRDRLSLIFEFSYIVPDPCRNLRCCCGAVCQVNASNQAVCKCLMQCPQGEQPVCGSDKNTYQNACQLRAAACTQQNPKLAVASQGSCKYIYNLYVFKPIKELTYHDLPNITARNLLRTISLA